MFQWIRQQPGHSFSSIPGMDPRADCLLGPEFKRFQPFGPEAPIPFILVAHDQDAVKFVNDLLGSTVPPQGALSIRPSVYTRHLGGNFTIGDSITLMAPRAFFERLADPDATGEFALLRRAAKQIQLSLPLNPALIADHDPLHPIRPRPNPKVRPPALGWPDDTVVVGIIDDGIAFANVRFRSNDGTSRVASFWQQDGSPKSATVDYGTELAKPDIDIMLAAHLVGGAVDEDAVYRTAGLVDFTQPNHKATALRLAHGTHVMDLAAGFYPGAPPTNRPIIAVQLPVAATAEQSGAGLETYVADAITFIQDRTQELAGNGPPLPVVINFSYGTLTGPHDGTFPLELAIDNAVNSVTPLTRIVVASGNSNEGRGHQRIYCEDRDGTTSMHWRVQPDGMTPSLLQVWMPYGDPNEPLESRVFLTITPPDFVESPELGEATGAGLILERDGRVVCEATYSFQPTPTQRGVFNICVEPTVRTDTVPSPGSSDPVASSGVWTINIRNVLLRPCDAIDAWIERNGLVYGYPRRGRQSYFDEASYVRFTPQGVEIADDPLVPNSNVRRAGMINALATGNQPIVVGGFKRKNNELANYSAGGPISAPRGGSFPPSQTKPDGVSVSDDSYVHYGLLAAGTRSGSTVPMLGTSVAAPQVIRWAADQFAAGAEVSRASFVASLVPLAASSPFDRAGAGRTNFPDTPDGPRKRYRS